MSFFKELLVWFYKSNTLGDEHRRRYQLINSISVELFLFGIILLSVNIYLKFWTIAWMLFVGILLVMGNIILLRKKYSLLVCGHYISSLALLIIAVGNLLLGGISTSYFGWFYVAPLIAAITVGMSGLILYTVISAVILSAFIFGQFHPIYYYRTDININLIDIVNYVLILIIIFTTLYSLLKENSEYESLLKEQNYLLHADKQKFHYMSYHDSLTNLPNRSYFHNHLQAMMDAMDTKTNTLALYFMDLDGFKKINDQHGHEIGDLLLLQTSKRLQSCFRESDFIARLGGDEFTAIIIYKIEEKIADDLMQRVIDEFKLPFHIKDLKIRSSISIGKANYPQDAQDSETLLKLADESMYLTKKTMRQKKTPVNTNSEHNKAN